MSGVADTAKIAARVKRMLDPSRKLKERYALMALLKEDGFTEKEMCEIYVTYSGQLFALLKEHAHLLEHDTGSKGKQLSTADALTFVQQVRNFIAFCSAQVAEGKLAAEIEQELLCALHVECSSAVRRAGVDALLHYMDVRQGGAGGVQRNLVDTLVSAIDWDYFRSLLAVPVVMPSTVTEIRGPRRAFYPPRARAVGDDGARGREATELLSAVLDFAAGASGSQLKFWWAALRRSLFPIFYPREAFAAEIIPAEVWDGFCSGVPPVVHRAFVDFLHAVGSDKERAALTILCEPADIRFTLITHLNTVRAVPTSMIATRIRSFEQLVAIGTSCAALFKSCAPAIFERHMGLACFSELPVLDGVAPEEQVPCFVAYVEALAELLMHVGASNFFPMPIKQLAMKQLLRLVVLLRTELSRASPPQPPPSPGADVYPYICQCAWYTVATVASPHTEAFVELVLPSIEECDALVPADSAGTPYLTKCWLYILLFASKLLCAINGSTETEEFSWPHVPRTDATPMIEKHPLVCSHRATRCESPLLVGELLRSQAHSGTASFNFVSRALHNCCASLSTDPVPVKRAKCVVLCEIARLFCDETRRGTIFVEPGSLLALMAPYLLIACRHQERDSPSSISPLAIEAACVIADIAGVQSVAAAETLTFSALGALDTLLADRGRTGWDATAQRLVYELCRSNAPSSRGMPMSNIFTVRHRAARTFCQHWFDVATAVLVASRSTGTSGQLESKASALTVQVWRLGFAYAGPGGREKQLCHVDAALRAMQAALVGKYPIPVMIGAATVGALGELHQTDTVEWAAVEGFVGIVLRHWTQLDPYTAQVAAGATHTLIDAVARRCADSKFRSAALRLAMGILEALCGAILFHLARWKITRTAEGALAAAFYVLTGLVTKVGNLHAPVCDGQTTAVQLVADVISFARRGQCFQHYAIQTHIQPFAIRVVGPASPAAEAPTPGAAPLATDVVTVPAHDRSEASWPANEAPGKATWMEPKEVVALAARLEAAVLGVTGNFPHVITGIARPVPVPQQAGADCANESSPGAARVRATYLLDNRSVVTAHGCGDAFTLDVEAATAAHTWTCTPLYSVHDAESLASQPKQHSGSLDSFFPAKRVTTNSALDTILEDFPVASMPRSLRADFPTEEGLVDTETCLKALASFSAAQLPAKPAPPPGAGLAAFLASSGLLGIGDGISKQRPLSGHMKPAPHCASVQAASRLSALCPQVALNAALVCACQSSKIQALAHDVGSAFGAPVETEKHRLFECVQPLTTLRLIAADSLVLSEDFAFTVVACRDFHEVLRICRAVEHRPPPVVFVLPGICPRSAIVHRVDTKGHLLPLLDGAPMPLSILAALLKGVMLSRQTLAKDPMVLRQRMIADSMAIEQGTFEAAVAPLLGIQS